jgi:hypothetical protein
VEHARKKGREQEAEACWYRQEDYSIPEVDCQQEIRR